MSDNESNSLEEDEIIKGIINHNFPNSSRPRSQMFPYTPEVSNKKKMNSVKTSKKTSPVVSPKPRTTRNSIISLKSPEDINTLSKQTSQQIIKSVYSLVSSKLPISLCESRELSKKDQEEIQHFFMTKKAQFKKILQEISNKCSKGGKRVPKDSLKLNAVLESRYLEEIERIQNKQKYLKNELVKKTSERILKEKTLMKKNMDVEAKKKKNEAKRIQRYEKEVIMKNIENYYKDQVNIVKDYYKKEIETKKIQDYEAKQLISEFIKRKKADRLKRYEELKLKYERELEDLKEKFNSIH
ncbi:hypothetical protein SteCoe_7990 [Stentor coeruleus]|uniref:Uncharacterized protein n=1 Tax=Stentor coeruleus TaxID=5963 RepID=A0A1R2CLE7_9CILI|nr:hypothetical protein SteCoe_7990 [Stentor coeruleus]